MSFLLQKARLGDDPVYCTGCRADRGLACSRFEGVKERDESYLLPRPKRLAICLEAEKAAAEFEAKYPGLLVR